MARKRHVKMDELLGALQEHDDEVVPYFDQQTGEVEHWLDPAIVGEPAFDREDPRWVEIPRVESRDAFRVMERFVDGVEELDVQRELRRALQGPGAFRRFRGALDGFPDLRARWETMQRSDLLERALAFLASLGIDPIYELREPRAAAPAPSGPSAPANLPRVLLHHPLLLGSPNGKTELIEGRVHRCVRTRSPAAARKQFERLAREMELQGLGWRRSAVEGLSSVDLGPFRLVLEQDVVWLATAVQREIWDAFR